jgi:predicted MFS family arabinose efflux permease
LPHIEGDLQSGYGALGLAVATGLLSYAVGAALASRVMRAVPTRGLLLGTFALSAVGFIVMAISTSPSAIAVAVTVLGVSAPVSWTATIHLGRESVSATSSGVLLAGASGGAAAGVIVNGVLVQTSDSIHPWRVSFALAAGVALVVMVLVARMFPDDVAKPERSGIRVLPLFGQVLKDPSGLMIVVTSGVSGLAVFVLSTFLTATAIDEMGTSAAAAATLLWIGGFVGVSAALVFGRLGDRRAPVFAIAVAMSAYSVVLIALTLGWSYPWLVAAMFGYGILNGPVWGLMGAAANRRFSSELGVAAVSLGLVGASLIAALGNSVSAIWLETTGSMRGPVTVLAAVTAVTGLYLIRETRRPVQPARSR